MLESILLIVLAMWILCAVLSFVFSTLDNMYPSKWLFYLATRLGLVFFIPLGYIYVLYKLISSWLNEIPTKKDPHAESD